MIIVPAHDANGQRSYALAAGTSLLAMALVALFSYGYVHGSIVEQGDAVATYGNLVSLGERFKAGIVGWIVILVSDIVAAWALYRFFKPIHSALSLLCAWLRLVYAAILGIAIADLVWAMLLAGGSSHAASLGAELSRALAMLALDAFDAVWSIGLIVFGGHLLLVGLLALRSPGIPRAFGWLLLLGGAGYIAVHLNRAFWPEAERLASLLDYAFIVPMTAGELGFGLWLLMRGGANPARGQA